MASVHNKLQNVQMFYSEANPEKQGIITFKTEMIISSRAKEVLPLFLNISRSEIISKADQSRHHDPLHTSRAVCLGSKILMISVNQMEKIQEPVIEKSYDLLWLRGYIPLSAYYDYVFGVIGAA